ncbi:helix-turn-helix domain-containing protein [Bacillota bacterium Lsc_1132]
MKYVDLEHVNHKESVKEGVELVNEERRQQWIEDGNRFLKWREGLGLSRAFIAQETGIDYGRINRFELGKPIKEARLISQVYKLTLEKVETHRILVRLLDSIGIKE